MIWSAHTPSRSCSRNSRPGSKLEFALTLSGRETVGSWLIAAGTLAASITIPIVGSTRGGRVADGLSVLPRILWRKYYLANHTPSLRRFDSKHLIQSIGRSGFRNRSLTHLRFVQGRVEFGRFGLKHSSKVRANCVSYSQGLALLMAPASTSFGSTPGIRTHARKHQIPGSRRKPLVELQRGRLH